MQVAQQQMMEVYKREKVRACVRAFARVSFPAAGRAESLTCLCASAGPQVHPLGVFKAPLIQMPIFVSFFFSLREMCSAPVCRRRVGGRGGKGRGSKGGGA